VGPRTFAPSAVVESHRSASRMSDSEDDGSACADSMRDVQKEAIRYGAKLSGTESVLRMGKFTRAEDDLILTTIAEFCADKGITPDEMVPELRTADTPGKMKRLMKQFLSQVKTLIPERKRQTLYRRTIRLIAGGMRGDEWTEEEKQQILSLHKLHGSKWTKIGSLLGRYADDVRDMYRRLRPRRRRGRFSEEESQRLVQLIMKHLNITGACCS